MSKDEKIQKFLERGVGVENCLFRVLDFYVILVFRKIDFFFSEINGQIKHDRRKIK